MTRSVPVESDPRDVLRVAGVDAELLGEVEEARVVVEDGFGLSCLGEEPACPSEVSLLLSQHESGD